MSNNKRRQQFIPNWPNNRAPTATVWKHHTRAAAESTSTNTNSIHEESLDLVPMNDLQQGELYIIKIKLIAIALFQGWDDEMCCFSILRTDLLDDLRWSEARYLPENFDAYLAFDYAGNPPIHLWTKQLRAVIPINWFNIFEEARHMQRQWHLSFCWVPNSSRQQQQNDYINEDDKVIGYHLTDDTIDYDNDKQEEKDEVIEQENQIVKYYSPQQQSTIPANAEFAAPINTTTPAMRLQDEYIVTQQQQQQEEKKDFLFKQQQQQTNIDHRAKIIDNSSDIVAPVGDEIKKKKSFSSFFSLKKKKSKKSLNEQESTSSSKRKSAPPTPTLNKEKYKRPSSTTIEVNTKQKEEEMLELPALISNNSNSSSTSRDNSSSPTVINPPKNDIDEQPLFDIDSYFDMQATFTFLNNTSQDTFSTLKKPVVTLTN